jgi:hypothetical protein
VLAIAAAGCGEFVRDQGRSPAQLIITDLTAGEDEHTLRSDVITEDGVFNDTAVVAMDLILKDPGVPGMAASPSAINAVTINRYRVEYRRTNGLNQPGTDVPHPFDSAVTFTVSSDGGSSDFQLVRHSAKEEAPLRALASSNAIISTIATVTFYGRDQAGNDVAVSGNIGIDFGNFADEDQ